MFGEQFHCSREVDRGKLTASSPGIGGAEEVARLEDVRQVAADVEGRPRLARPTRSSSSGSGVGGPAARSAWATRQLFSALLPWKRRFSRSRGIPVAELLDHHVDRARRGLQAGDVEVVAPPVEGLEGRRRDRSGRRDGSRVEVGGAERRRRSRRSSPGPRRARSRTAQTSTTSKRSWCSSGSLCRRMRDAERALQLVEDRPLLLLEGAGDLGVDAQQELRRGRSAPRRWSSSLRRFRQIVAIDLIRPRPEQ